MKPVPEVTLRQAVPADVDEITRLYSSDPWLYIGEPTPSPGSHEKAREMYLDRLRRGETCFLAMCGDAIAHVNWICYRWGDALPEHPLRLRAGEIYTTDALTPSQFRGKGLHVFVLRTMLAHARAHGYCHAYTLARVERPDVYSGLFHVGYRKCGRVIYFLPRGRSKAWFLWRQGNLEPLFRPD
ncbi:MAG: hypothetical protein ABI724_10015 [Betaproteobacteria bacterium]